MTQGQQRWIQQHSHSYFTHHESPQQSSMNSDHYWAQPVRSPTMESASAPWTPSSMGGERRFAQGFPGLSEDSGSQTFSTRPSPSSGGSPSPVDSSTARPNLTSRSVSGNLHFSNSQWAQPHTAWPQDTEHAQVQFRTSGSLGPLDHALDSPYREEAHTTALQGKEDRSGYSRTDLQTLAKPSYTEPWACPQQSPTAEGGATFQHGYLPLHDIANRTASEQHQASLETMRMSAHQRFSSWKAQPKEQLSPEHSRLHSSDDLQDGVVSKSEHHRAPYQPARNGVFGELGSRFGLTPASDLLNSNGESSSPYQNGQVRSQGLSMLSGNAASVRPSTQIVPRIENGEQEFSVFVGDLCPDLREEDLINQFLHPPPWPPSHPLAIAVSNAQQAQGFYGMLPRLGPAPFLDTKSATVMTDPLTGASRGFGFIRFASEADCARALLEMQGVIVQPLSGQGGRPLRVCPATPKNRSSLNAPPPLPTPNFGKYPFGSFAPPQLQDTIASSYQGQQQQQQQDISSAVAGSPFNSVPITPTALSPGRSGAGESLASYSTSALDPNNSTVFVGGLSSLISEETLKTFFLPFGEIKYVKIPPGKGCGFVQFAQKTDAERAIERMQGFPIGGGRIRLSWGRSQGDKAVAAATYAAAQAAQIGRLAGLVGLNASETSRLTAAALQATASGSATGGDAHSMLIQRLAAAAQAGVKFDSTGAGLQNGDRSGSDSRKEQDEKSTFDSQLGSPYRQFAAQARAYASNTAESLSSVPKYSTSPPWAEQEHNETQHRRSRTETDEVLSSMLSDLSVTTPTPRRHMTVTEPHTPAPYTSSHGGRTSDIFSSPVSASQPSPDQLNTWFASSQLSNSVHRRVPMPSLPEHDAYSESFNPFGQHDSTIGHPSSTQKQ